MNKKNIITIFIALLVVLAVTGAAIGLVYAARMANISFMLNFSPDTGIKYVPSKDTGEGYFEIYSYYGLTWIGSDAVIDTIGNVNPSGQVSSTAKMATVSASYHQACNITYLSDYKTKSGIANPNFPLNKSFTGIYDGHNYEIKNLQSELIYNSTNSYTGIFDTNNGVIRNVHLSFENATVLGGGNGAAGNTLNHSFLVKDNASSGVIENCISSGNFANTTKTYNNLGIFAYQSSGAIKGCINNLNATLSGSGSGIGGIVFTASGGNIENNLNKGALKASINAGGIVGSSTVNASTKIASNYNSGVIESLTNAGGIVGSLTVNSTVSVTANINNGIIKGNDYIGGIIGFADTKNGSTTNIEANINNAEVLLVTQSASASMAGIVGYIAHSSTGTRTISLKGNINASNVLSLTAQIPNQYGVANIQTGASYYTMTVDSVANLNNGLLGFSYVIADPITFTEIANSKDMLVNLNA